MGGVEEPVRKRAGGWRPSAALVGVGAVLVVLAVGGGIAVSVSGDDTSDAATTASSGTAPSDLPTLAPAPSESSEVDTGVPGARAEARRPRSRAVPLGETASAGRGVTVAVSDVEWVRGKTVIPGEVGGNALRVTFTASNSGDRDVVLSGSVANLYYGPDKAPSSFLLEPGSTPFPETIPAGDSIDGVFVFTLPKDPDVRVVAEVDLDDQLRIVTFTGTPAALL